jgi:hypothetical protein
MSSRPTLSQLGDGWYESEQRTGAVLVFELKRIRRRIAVRPLPVLLLAALLTAGVTYKVLTKEGLFEAEIILALTEGSLTSDRSGLPADQLREYVTSVLLADKNMLHVIEKHDLTPLRKKLGPQFAVQELWDNVDVDIWKNSFLYFSADDAEARKSARISISVRDTDPDRGYEVARDLARLAITTHEAERQKVTGAIAREVEAARASLAAQLDSITTAVAMKQTALAQAQKDRKQGLASQLHVDLTALDHQAKQIEDQMALVLQSPEAIADEIAAAGLDINLGIVEERRPERPENPTFGLVIVITIIAIGSLVGAALLVGSFDTRIHDTDDVERLGLPVLGHLPAFTGDHVGSLRARGAARPHRSSVMRWLSLR